MDKQKRIKHIETGFDYVGKVLNQGDNVAFVTPGGLAFLSVGTVAYFTPCGVTIIDHQGYKVNRRSIQVIKI